MDRTTKEFRDSAGRCAPGSEGLQRATGEELMVDPSMINVCDAPGSKPHGHPGADVACSKGKIRVYKDIIKLRKWNVRSMILLKQKWTEPVLAYLEFPNSNGHSRDIFSQGIIGFITLVTIPKSEMVWLSF